MDSIEASTDLHNVEKLSSLARLDLLDFQVDVAGLVLRG